MHKYIILFFSVLLFSAACSNSSKPDGVLEKPQMLSLLTDIHILDGELYNIPQQGDSLYKYGSNKYKALFKKHHTTDAEFKKSLQYYARQPEEIQEMYDSLTVIVQRKTDSLNKKSPTKLKNAVPQQ
jgi:hypothetical protein